MTYFRRYSSRNYFDFSVYPSISACHAGENLREIPSLFHSLFQNLEMKLVPWSDIIYFRSPCYENTDKKICSSSSDLTVSAGIKCCRFVSLSQITTINWYDVFFLLQIISYTIYSIKNYWYLCFELANSKEIRVFYLQSILFVDMCYSFAELVNLFSHIKPKIIL